MKFWSKTRNLPIYYHITFPCCTFVIIPTDNYTHVATYRLAAYLCVYMVPVKCEKYSVKSENLGESPHFFFFHSTTSITLYLTLPTESDYRICVKCYFRKCLGLLESNVPSFGYPVVQPGKSLSQVRELLKEMAPVVFVWKSYPSCPGTVYLSSTTSFPDEESQLRHCGERV